MLILTRKEGESIRIGPDVICQVMEISGKRVRIGIQAPDTIKIMRQELYQAVKESNLRAADQANALSGAELINQWRVRRQNG